MNEQTGTASAVFMEVTSKKIEMLDKKITAIEEAVKDIPANTQPIEKVLIAVEALRSDLKNASLQPEEMRNLSDQLSRATVLLKHLVFNKVQHHHHIPKLTWISAGLFLALSLVCSRWYITSNKLENFIANDTKYRWLRLDTSQRSLQIYLDRVDDLFNSLPDMRKKVDEVEEEYRVNFERLQKAERLKAEAKQLEKAAKEKR